MGVHSINRRLTLAKVLFPSRIIEIVSGGTHRYPSTWQMEAEGSETQSSSDVKDLLGCSETCEPCLRERQR